MYSKILNILKRAVRKLFLIAVLLFLSACAHIIEKDLLRQVNPDITFVALQENSDLYKGQMVLFGGTIIETVNKKGGTLLEILQSETDVRGKPVKPDNSEGRFLAFCENFLESEIYRKGREVTIAGLVEGERVMKLGEIDYHYPYIKIKQIHLWSEEQRPCPRPYPWPYWYPLHAPPWHPWYDPYWFYHY